MSQEKVEKYKQEKANRKKNIKKEKRLHVLRVIFYSLIALAILGFLGWSVYDKFIREEEKPTTMSQEEWSSMLEEYMRLLYEEVKDEIKKPDDFINESIFIDMFFEPFKQAFSLLRVIYTLC